MFTSSPNHSIVQQNLTSLSSSSTRSRVSVLRMITVCQSELGERRGQRSAIARSEKLIIDCTHPPLLNMVAQNFPEGEKAPHICEAVPPPSFASSLTSKKTSPSNPVNPPSPTVSALALLMTG